MPFYSNDDFLQKYESDQLDIISISCWILGVESDHYIVSFETVNCTGNSKMPFSLVDQVETIGRRRCRGNDGVWLELPRVRLYLKKPDNLDGAILFEILKNRDTNLEVCECMGDYSSSGTEQEADVTSGLDELFEFVDLIFGSGIGCNSYLLSRRRCRNDRRCYEGFRVLREFHENPSQRTVQRLSDWMQASGLQEQCMRAIVEYAKVGEYSKFVGLILVILA